VKLVAKFTGCKETTLGTKCQNTATEGEIVTNSLDGELGVVKKGTEAAKNKIGVDLKPEAAGGKEAEFSCAGGAIKIEVIGSVIHEVKANSMLLTAKETFKCKAPAKQEPEKFEGEPVDILESKVNAEPFEHSCQRIKSINTGEEKIEANSVV
jgi:hypothetical protein